MSSYRNTIMISVCVATLAGCAGGPPRGILLGQMTFGPSKPAAKVQKSGIVSDEAGALHISKESPIRVEFKNSPTLAKEWAGKLKERGYNLRDDGDKLTVLGVFTANGKFEGHADLVNTGSLNIGDLVEDSLVSKAAEQWNNSKSGIDVTIVPSGTFQGTAATSVAYMGIDALLEATGVANALDSGFKKAVGADKDPYKYCMFGCDEDRARFMQPTQVAYYAMQYKDEKKLVRVISYDSKFDAAEIIRLAEEKALNL